MTRRAFGTVPGEGDVEEIVIGSGDLTVSVINWGAVVRDVRLAGVEHPLVLGFDRLEDYIAHSPYFGAMAGRCANRIREGRFAIDGNDYQVVQNESGHHLHGGPGGFGKRVWRIEEYDDVSVTLGLTSADGDQGYPGEVRASVRYSVEGSGTLRVDASAETTAPTPINLAHHSYFNLDGSADILDHRVQIHADAITVTGDADIPTGEIRDVGGTEYDFREARPVRWDGEAFPYDKNFAVAMEREAEPRPLARLVAPSGDVSLEVSSTEPGVQFYSGYKLNVPLPGLDGRSYGAYAGCCFEPQMFPDAVNNPGFATSVVRPGERYAQTSLFAFARS